MSTCIEYRLPKVLNEVSARPENLAVEAKRRAVLVYRNDLVERSETFVVAQADAMQRFQPVYCGLARRDGGILPADARTAILTGDGRVSRYLRKKAFMYGGWARRWQRQCMDFRPVLIHAHFAVDAAFALPLKAALRLPMMVSLHGYDVTHTDRALQRTAGGRLLLRRREDLFAQADVFLCVSEFIRKKALERGYPEKKLWVHATGVDLEMFTPTGSVAREETVLFVGRLVEKKGCAHLIRAMQLVQKARPSARLVIVGDGPLRRHLETLAANLLDGRHVFLGAQPAHVVRGWLQRSMVLSVPSVTAADGNAEGLGMVFLEAQAMGVPVVSSASGGISEAVLDGGTGFLVPERDERQLAEKIGVLLGDRLLWTQMSRLGRRWMAEKFNLRLQTKLLEEKYDKVIAAALRG